MLFDPTSSVSVKVTFAIAVAGFILSLLSWIKDIVTSRKKISIRVISARSTGTSTLAFLMFSNKSRLPITVTGISCKVSGEYCPCLSLSRLALKVRHSGGETRDIYSTPFPLTVPGLGGQQLLILFEDLPKALADSSTVWTVRVFSNRGRPVQMKLQLPEAPFDLATIL